MDGLGPLTIGPREIYDQLTMVRSAMERLATQGEGTATTLADHETRLRAVERDDDHEQRLRKLEGSRWPLPALAALVAIASLVLAAYGALKH